MEGWQPCSLTSDLDVVIIPSGSMVKDSIVSDVSYDLDTSLLIRDKSSGQVFFNNVDTPLGINDLEKVNEFSLQNWGKPVDIACLPVGAASEYPHCFLNIDREEEKKRVISNCLDELADRLTATGAATLFIAGGTYVIRGKYACLNGYIAQPSFGQIEDALKGCDCSTHYIEGGGQFAV